VDTGAAEMGDATLDAIALLDSDVIDTYRSALNLGAFHTEQIANELGLGRDQVQRAKAVLLQLHLLIQGHGDKPPAPADPELAEAELSARINEEFQRRQKAIAHVHGQLYDLRRLYRDRNRPRHASSAVTVYKDAADVRRELATMLHRCQREIVMMQPGGDHKTLRQIVSVSLTNLQRGVRMRIIYQHSARASLATQADVQQFTAAGAEVRTMIDTFERLIIIDGEVACVPMAQGGTNAPGAAIVRDTTVVGFLSRSFENLWELAMPFEVTHPNPGTKPDDIHAAILALLTQGHKDETIARRLGIATRTCRRHIRTIVNNLGARSRFQAGVRALHVGLVSVDPDSP
jgi:DNA-binding CsgD family transcriptional regulator